MTKRQVNDMTVSSYKYINNKTIMSAQDKYVTLRKP